METYDPWMQALVLATQGKPVMWTAPHHREMWWITYTPSAEWEFHQENGKTYYCAVLFPLPEWQDPARQSHPMGRRREGTE